MHLFENAQSRGYARLAGVFYLIIAVAGGFSIAYVPSQLQVAGDPAATFANIAAHPGLFHLGLAGDLVMMLAEIMVTAMLFFMFRPVNATLSLAAALARFAMVTVMAAMLFFHIGAMALVRPDLGLGSLSAAQRLDLAGLLLAMHDGGVWIWQVFFTAHLLLLGQLVARSGRFPRVLGQALSLGGLGYLLDSIHAFAAPDADWLGMLRIALLVLVTLAEIGFALWLVFGRVAAARVTAPAAA
ncbi:DUF4386 domain-containing protein [Pseudooceanicola sp.]|uniref:DUF4386 domain-containing protein n=1 Tax=Pseudooceanicola sp. TaxID=1914328 RepID=UPI0026302851|nr:DUF4386 domain-containing protein [Pseudooceanicola sp.]MDF1856214.1 DUF4386 domain-containing protein [Pseudooceanicola sp.]